MSSKNFDAYSAYYDLLYATKDYAREVDFVDQLISQYAPGARSVIDLGCGTGRHDWLLAAKGYDVLGIDQSAAMLDIARAVPVTDYPTATSSPRFQVGDLTTFSVERPADVVVSLFDVFSYLPDYTALRAAAGNIVRSLKPGGVLIFDCWYGPAVYTQQPGTRLRRLENEQVELTRVASADFDQVRNRIDVRYDMFVKWKADGHIETFSELHPMRCYFNDELIDLLAPFGLSPVFAMEWFTMAAPSAKTWSALFGFQLSKDA